MFVDAACVIAPLPVVLSVTAPVVAVTLPATFNAVPLLLRFTANELSDDAFSVTTLLTPAEVSAIVTAADVFAVKFDAALVTFIVPVPDDMFNELLALSLIYDVPVVLTANVGAFVNIYAPLVPILPLPELSVNVPPVDMFVAAASVIAPLPYAFNVTELPLKFAFTAIPLLLPLLAACIVNAPLAVIEPLTTTLPVPLPTVSFNVNIAPVDAPLTVVVAALSLM
jgi:hypothetical protein